MELTDNDRQRIEQFAREYGESFKTGEWFENLRIESCKVGAKYATLYEREQQQEQLEKSMNTVRGLEELYANTHAKLRDLQKEHSDNKANLHRAYKGLENYKKQIETLEAELHKVDEKFNSQLEAERSEVQNDLHKYKNALTTAHEREKELRNKVIDEVKTELMSWFIFTDPKFSEINELLNSLKK